MERCVQKTKNSSTAACEEDRRHVERLSCEQRTTFRPLADTRAASQADLEGQQRDPCCFCIKAGRLRFRDPEAHKLGLLHYEDWVRKPEEGSGCQRMWSDGRTDLGASREN